MKEMCDLAKAEGDLYELEPFFELSPDLLCIAGYDGYFKKVNPAFKTLLGYPDEVLYSRPINDFVFDGDKESTSTKRYQLTQNQPLLNFENRYVSQSGEVIWLSWTSISVSNSKLIYAIAKNISHTKKLEAERNELLSIYSRANRGLKLLNYSTSHDLRSPVANLQTIFGLLDLSMISDAPTRNLLELMQESTEHLHKALDDYLERLSRNDNSEIPVEDLDLTAVLEHVRQSIGSLINNTSTRFLIDFSAYTNLRFNRHYLESILLNLITNSLKYAREGVPAVIRIYTKINDGVKQLVVSDNGQGFDRAKVSDRIFGIHQKFNDHTDSKGIGLYLVHSHVTSLGGKIELESQVNKGATFTISFSTTS